MTIGEKPVELFFGYTAHRSLIEGAQMFRDQYLNAELGLSDYGYAKLLHAAYENNCLNKRIAPVLVFDDFMEYIDVAVRSEAGTKEFGAAIQEWFESRHTKKMLEDAKNAPVEKKSESTSQNSGPESTSTITNEPALAN